MDGPKLLNDRIATSGLTKAEVARRVGVKPSTISNWTSGIARPAFDNLQQVDQLLNAEGDLLEAFGFARPRRDGEARASVEAAILADEDFTPADKKVLLEVVETFRRQAVARKAR